MVVLKSPIAKGWSHCAVIFNEENIVKNSTAQMNGWKDFCIIFKNMRKCIRNGAITKSSFVRFISSYSIKCSDNCSKNKKGAC